MAVLIPLILGGLIAFYANRAKLQGQWGQLFRITRFEFVAASVAIVFVAIMVTIFVGPNLARESAVKGYHQFYNGSVTQARVVADKCERDGSCAHEYRCDPYEVKVVDRAAYTDSDGNYHSEISHWETRYHHCPYATVELDYVLDDSIGRTVTVAANYFESNPKEWRRGHGIPGDVPRDIPARWTQAKTNLANGFSDPVTDVRTYANYVLASDNDLYKKYDGHIPEYQKLQLLPPHTANINNNPLYDYDMRADKLAVVGGLKVSSLELWQDRLMRLNAALGSNLQGDMHVVLVPASKVTNPDEYISTLKAYWTSLGKWSIAKNGIILAIGVSDDGSTVDWSRSETGMPFGNGEMRTALNLNLQNLAFSPDVLFGNVSAAVRQDGKKLKVSYDFATSGAVGQIVFVDFPFKRACMECKDKGDTGVGYVNLKDQIPVTTGAKVLMFFVVLIVSTALWGLVLYFEPFAGLIQNFKPGYGETSSESDNDNPRQRYWRRRNF